MKYLIILLLGPMLLACGSTTTPPSQFMNQMFPKVRGQSLTKESVVIPDKYQGKPAVLLIGYTQDTQFDIDRWILGLLQADIAVQIIEIPTIAGMIPRMVQKYIDNGMRSGIPEKDWASVVTVYEDAPKIIAVLGNERPQSAHAVLLNDKGEIVWSSNLGYSATQVLELKQVVEKLSR